MKNEKGEKTITFEEVENRLQNTELYDMTAQDVMDRYIAYGTDKELNNPEIQKLFIKFGYVDELINLVSGVITDKIVIKKILSSHALSDKNLIAKTGKIQKIALLEDSDLPEDVCWMNISFLDENNQESILKDMYFKNIRDYEDDIDKYNEIMKYKGQPLTAIIENEKQEFKLKCFLLDN